MNPIKTLIYILAVVVLLTGCRGAKLSVADEQMARGEYFEASKPIVRFIINLQSERSVLCVGKSLLRWGNAMIS